VVFVNCSLNCVKEISFKMVVNEKDNLVEKQIPSEACPTDGKIEHCQCGTGCVDCYGKFNCGCPDCYTPEKKPRKKKKLKIRKAEVVKVTLDSVSPLEQVLYETCILSHHVGKDRAKINRIVINVDEEVEVVKRSSYSNYHFKRRPVSCIEKTNSRSSHRMSLPDMDFNLKLEKPKKREKLRDPLIVKEVGPPKQTKYFCKKCQKDICTACFKTVCSTHNVQFIGTAKFHCESPFHNIDHDQRSPDLSKSLFPICDPLPSSRTGYISHRIKDHIE